MRRNIDQELAEHLQGLLDKAIGCGGRVVVELEDDPGAGYVLQSVRGSGELGLTLKYTAGVGRAFSTDVTTQGDDRVRKTADGLSGRDLDGETIRVRLEKS